MLSKIAVAVATAAAALALAMPGAASASSHTPLVFSNTPIVNSVNPGSVQFHGLGNLVTAGSNASSMSQGDCQRVSWLGQFDVNVCEWFNGSHLCMGASSPDALVRAEACTGSSTQLWWTARVPNSPVNNFYILNQHWTGTNGSDVYMEPLSNSLGSDISAAFSNAPNAIWLI